MEKDYSFRVYDGPPVGIQYPPWNTQVGNQGRDHNPEYLGDLFGVISWTITEEINNLASSADIVISPTRDDSTLSEITTFLADDGTILSDDGDDLIDDVVTTSDSATQDFIVTPADYGRFVEIVRNRVSGNTTTTQVVFHGMITSFEQSSARRAITVRLQSLGWLAANYPAIFTLGFWGQAQSLSLAPANRLAGRIPELRLDAAEPTYGRAHKPVDLINWMINSNPFVTGTFASEATTDSAVIAISIGVQGIADVLAECMEALGEDYYFWVRYDLPPIPRIAPLAIDYATYVSDPTVATIFGLTGDRYTPGFRLVYDPPNNLDTATIITPGDGVTSWDVNFDGADSVQRVVRVTEQQNPVYVTDISSDDRPIPNVEIAPVRVIDVRDDMGNITGSRDDPRSVYYRRAIGDTFFGGDFTDQAPREIDDDIPPNIRGKRSTDIPMWSPVTLLDLSEQSTAITRDSDREPVSNYLRAATRVEIDGSRNPTYTTRVSVVDTPSRPIEFYRVGMKVAFSGFGGIIDNSFGRISGIRRTQLTAELTINKVLPTTNRRLQELERQVIRISRADRRAR